MSDQEIEQAIAVVMGQAGPVNPSLINSCAQLIFNIQNSLDGLTWCISRYPSFGATCSATFALTTIRDWLLNRASEIPAEQQKQIQALLFNPETQRTFESETNQTLFDSVFSTAQLQFMFATYPSVWPAFWSDLLKLDAGVAIRFLEKFVMCGDEKGELCQAVQMTMSTDGSEAAVVAFVIECLVSGNQALVVPAFAVLSRLVLWVDVEPIFRGPVVPMIVEGITNEEKLVTCVEMLKEGKKDPNNVIDMISLLVGLLSAPIDPAAKAELLRSMDLPSKIAVICEKSECEELLAATASLIVAAGGQVIETPDIAGYFQLALKIMACRIQSVSGETLCFVKECVERCPEAGVEAMKVVFLRLAQYFVDLDDDATEMDAYGDDLLKIAEQVSHSNKEGFVAVMKQIMESVSGPSQVAAVFHILLEAHSSYVTVADDDAVLEKFAMVLQETPLDKESYLAMTVYLKFVIRRMGVIREKTKIKACFIILCKHVMFDYPEAQRTTFANLLYDMIKSRDFAKAVNLSHEEMENVLALINTQNPDIVSSVSKIIMIAPEEMRQDLFGKAIGRLTHEIQHGQDKKQAVELTLTFIKNLKYQRDGMHIGPCLEVLTQIMQVIHGDDGLFADSIRALNDSTGPAGASLLAQVVNQGGIPGIESFVAILSACSNMESNLDNEWTNNFLIACTKRLISEIRDVTVWLAASEQVRQICFATNSYFLWAGKVVRAGRMADQTIQAVVEFSIELLKTCLEEPKILTPILLFLQKLPPSEVTAQQFASLLVLLIRAGDGDAYNPGNPSTQKIYQYVMILHKRLYEKAPEQFVAGLRASMQFQNANVAIDRYLAFLQHPETDLEGKCQDIVPFMKELYAAVWQ